MLPCITILLWKKFIGRPSPLSWLGRPCSLFPISPTSFGPVRRLGIRGGESWRTFAWIFALVAGFGVLLPTLLSIRVSGETMGRAVPLLPSVLFFAAVNALTEEIYFRASFLSTLHDVVGKTHTLLLTSVYFGLAHWL